MKLEQGNLATPLSGPGQGAESPGGGVPTSELQKFVEAVPMAMVLFGADQRALLANAAATTLFGADVAGRAGSACEARKTPIDRANSVQPVIAVSFRRQPAALRSRAQARSLDRTQACTLWARPRICATLTTTQGDPA